MYKLFAFIPMAIATLTLASTAGATSPVRGTFDASIHFTFPAGTACAFAVQVDIDGVASFAIYDNPPKNIIPTAPCSSSRGSIRSSSQETLAISARRFPRRQRRWIGRESKPLNQSQ